MKKQTLEGQMQGQDDEDDEDFEGQDDEEESKL
jgi:hypothetical protein